MMDFETFYLSKDEIRSALDVIASQYEDIAWEATKAGNSQKAVFWKNAAEDLFAHKVLPMGLYRKVLMIARKEMVSCSLPG